MNSIMFHNNSEKSLCEVIREDCEENILISYKYRYCKLQNIVETDICINFLVYLSLFLLDYVLTILIMLRQMSVNLTILQKNWCYTNHSTGPFCIWPRIYLWGFRNFIILWWNPWSSRLAEDQEADPTPFENQSERMLWNNPLQSADIPGYAYYWPHS